MRLENPRESRSVWFRARGLMLAALAVLAAGGCGGSSKPEQAADGPKKLRIAVIPKGTTHEFWKSVHYGAQRAADELGNVEIIWKGSQLENDTQGQISVVEDFIVQKVDGICLAPLDSESLVPYVKHAKEKGIPTVIFDSGLADESIIVSYVATDNREGGVLAGKELGQQLEGKGNVILLRYNAGSESTYQREEGFLETLQKDYPEIKILSSGEYSGTTPETSLDKCLQLFSRFKSEVDGCFAVCEPNATGMLRALEESNLALKVKFIAFDPSPDLVAAMAAGSVHGIVLQDPVEMGYQAVKTMAAHLRGEQVDKRINTGVYMATPENMETPQMRKLLAPPKFGD